MFYQVKTSCFFVILILLHSIHLQCERHLKADLGHKKHVIDKNLGDKNTFDDSIYNIVLVTGTKQNPPLGKDFLVLFHL